MNTSEMKSLIIALARFSRVPMRGKDNNRLGIHVITIDAMPVAVTKGIEPRDPEDEYQFHTGRGIITYYPKAAASAAEVAQGLAEVVEAHQWKRNQAEAVWPPKA